MLGFFHLLVTFVVNPFRSRRRVEIENLFLRHLSFPKIPSGLDSRDGAKLSHHETRCLRSFMPLERLSPTWSSPAPGLKPRYCFFGIS
jgi:hypothetical protein